MPGALCHMFFLVGGHEGYCGDWKCYLVDFGKVASVLENVCFHPAVDLFRGSVFLGLDLSIRIGSDTP